MSKPNLKTKFGAAVIDRAAEQGVDPHDLADALIFLWDSKRQYTLEIERCLQHARRATGLTRGRINQWEESGRDHSTWPGLDVVAADLASEFPQLGLHSHHDHAAALWEALRRGKERIQPRHDPALLDEALGRLVAHSGQRVRRQRKQNVAAPPPVVPLLPVVIPTSEWWDSWKRAFAFLRLHFERKD